MPGFDDEELRRTLNGNAGAGADADLPDEVRFRGGVTRLIRKRLAKMDHNSSENPAVFILTGVTPAGVPQASMKMVPMLDNGLTAVESHVWFVGPSVVLGRGVAVEQWADHEVFDSATAWSVGGCPTILYETRTEPAEARYYPNGLMSPEDYELLRLGGDGIAMDDILEVVDHVYTTSLVTPGAQAKAGKLWKTAGKYWVADDAEDVVQLYLKTGLITAFPSCFVRGEQSQVSGRLDLEIEEPTDEDPSMFVRHAILELKVLRGFGSTGKRHTDAQVKKWISEGVEQAEEYRIERRSRSSALCCFDMRKDVSGDRCFAHVRAYAKAAQVTLRVWHIFASAKEYRAYNAAARRAKTA